MLSMLKMMVMRSIQVRSTHIHTTAKYLKMLIQLSSLIHHHRQRAWLRNKRKSMTIMVMKFNLLHRIQLIKSNKSQLSKSQLIKSQLSKSQLKRNQKPISLLWMNKCPTSANWTSIVPLVFTELMSLLMIGMVTASEN